MLENAMAAGIWPYDQEYAPEPFYTCPRCLEPIGPEDAVFEWKYDWICADCFRDAILSLSADDRADMSCESIAYTEQQLELVDYNAKAIAEILCVETKNAEDIA